MSDDIVDRLRDVVAWCPEPDSFGAVECAEAADEIERLRDALAACGQRPSPARLSGRSGDGS